MSWMLLGSGRIIDPDNRASLASMTLAEIAHGLRHTIRWNGQSRVPISVLAHSLACATAAARDRRAPRVVLACLYHDVAECVLGDMRATLKRLPGLLHFRLLDAEYTNTLLQAHAPEALGAYATGAHVHYDRAALNCERLNFFPPIQDARDWPPEPPLASDCYQLDAAPDEWIQASDFWRREAQGHVE